MKLATSQNADKQNAPQQMKADPAAGKSMSPPPFAPEASSAAPAQLSKLDGEKDEDKLATAQLKSEEEEDKLTD